MKLGFSVFLMLVLALAVLGNGRAEAMTSPSLGISAGAVIPDGKISSGTLEWDLGRNWGFFVDIPLLKSFHITPSAEIYSLKDINATDMSLAFKFMIPLRSLSLYLGVVPGMTALPQDIRVNLGGAVGLSFHLISNTAFFVQGKYKEVFGDDSLRVIHLNAGIMFYF